VFVLGNTKISVTHKTSSVIEGTLVSGQIHFTIYESDDA